MAAESVLGPRLGAGYYVAIAWRGPLASGIPGFSVRGA
jgi:hypothetical protein